MSPSGAKASGSAALLVVDVQRAAVEREPYRCDEVLENIVALVGACRSGGVEVVYVQHDGEAGGDLEPGSPGWELHEEIRPVERERVVRKRFNSAFRETDLHRYLRSSGVSELIVVGIQTEYCIDTTVRVAFELGYDVTIPELTNTTYDNEDLTGAQIYDHHNRRIFDGRFGVVRPLAYVLSSIRSA